MVASKGIINDKFEEGAVVVSKGLINDKFVGPTLRALHKTIGVTSFGVRIGAFYVTRSGVTRILPARGGALRGGSAW